MSDHGRDESLTTPLDATPDTQSAPRAKAGGTGARNDFSRSAQRSRSRKAEDEAPPSSELQRPVRTELGDADGG